MTNKIEQMRNTSGFIGWESHGRGPYVVERTVYGLAAHDYEQESAGGDDDLANGRASGIDAFRKRKIGRENPAERKAIKKIVKE